MAFPRTFGSLTGTVPASYLDDNFSAISDATDVAEGDALIGVKLTEANSAARTGHAVNEEKVRTPGDYSATFATALSTWNTNKAAGGLLRVPAGSHSLTAGATFDGQRPNIEGDGRQVSIVNFQPAGAGAAITFNEGSAGGMYQGGVRGMGFTGGANTQNKTAISFVNTANCEIDQVGIASGAWLGDSIGVKTAGRQSLRFSYSEIACARPVVIGLNATFPTICTDFFVFEHLELIGTSASYPVIEFEDGVVIGSMTLRNIACVGGKDGLLWNDTTSAGASYHLALDGFRSEQGLDATGYSINLQTTAQSLQTLHITNALLDSARNGIKLRGALRVHLEQVDFNQGVGLVALDMTFVAGSRLTMVNCWQQTGSTVTLANAKCVRRERVSALGFVEEWVYDANSSAGSMAADVAVHGVPFTVADNATAVISDNGLTGFVLVTNATSNASGGFCINGSSNSVSDLTALDPFGAFSATATTAGTNVYWDAGSSRYVIENKTGAPATYTVHRVCTSA